MRKYYLFIINKDYKSIYSSNSNTLYQMLYNLYKLSFDDLRIGFSIYNQIWKTFNKKILMNYFKEKYNLKKKKDKIYLVNNKERIIIKINYSCVVIYTNVNIPKILKILYLYSKDIFIADFNNEDYFWLTKETLK